jgi:adenylylsulfate kinase
MGKKIISNKNKGILFWITGLSGSGKTAIAKKIYKKISHLYGPTIEISGDDFRKIFRLNKYTKKARIEYLPKYLHFCKLITDQKINLIFNLIGMYNRARRWNRKNIDNYVEIYIKADIHKIIKLKRKATYLKNKKNIVGLDIKPEFPKKPNIVIKNDFNKSTDKLAKELLSKIKNLNL